MFLNVVGTALHLALGEAAGGKGFTNVNSCVLIDQRIDITKEIILILHLFLEISEVIFQ